MGQLVAYFLRLGALGFGGPAALVAIMEDDLVERSHWLSREEYLEGLAICQTLPGPLAIQVGIYVGYVQRGVLGVWMAGAAFILPPFLIVLASVYLYQRFSALTQVQALFYGISPVVIALIVRSCYTLGKIADHQPGREVLIDKMSQNVSATGTLVKKGGVQMLYVETVK